MKKNQVQIGGTYVAKVSGQLAQVRIDAENRFGGWDATNVSTRRRVCIKSAHRLRREVWSAETGRPTTAETTAARAEAAQSEVAADEPQYDPSRCATPRCIGAPAMTYLDRPLFQACWDRHCEEEQPSEVIENVGDACPSAQAGRPSEEHETHEQENVMSRQKSTKRPSTKKPKKAQPAATKANGSKNVVKPKAKATAEKKPKRISALDAAAQVLKSTSKPMRAQELIASMAEQNLWKSPAGKTPHATLYAAMMREARDGGKASRFRKVDRGMFAFNKVGA